MRERTHAAGVPRAFPRAARLGRWTLRGGCPEPSEPPTLWWPRWVGWASIKVEKAHVAIDCGRAINPGHVEAQMSSGVVDAMSVAFRAKVTIKDGRAEQSSFGDYQILRMGEEPQVITHIVEIGSPLGGAGGPGVPPLAPALAAAASALSGRQVRRLPLADEVLA
ncbi:molybdopterin cofactor-binding domain-containing protein [Variovorax beijingensis]|uniref:molybdopterin cofactor-binding domain-containing protein n=1 Tax=Variovorax beijingensis TaxID=2496117 RepID=UPI0028F6E810|nr:molybdopterin cofactor-binding domain-containing protein [Variovorax beijingensis]